MYASARKHALAAVIADRLGVTVSTDAIFDVQIKRIHEYKRQLLNILLDGRALPRAEAQPLGRATRRG